MGHEKRLTLATKGRTILDSRYEKAHYQMLTESIGSNPIIKAARYDIEDSLLPHHQVVSVIGERIRHIESNYSYFLTIEPRILIHLHCHYVSMCPYMAHYLQNIHMRHDLLITTSDGVEDSFFFTLLKSSHTENIKVIRV